MMCVVFGRGGDTVYLGKHRRITGYGTPDKPHAADDVEDGTPAINIRPAVDTDAGALWCVKGPLLNPDLEAGEVDPAIEGQRSMFDYVSWEEYCTEWVKLGAIMGTIQGGKFEVRKA